MDFLTGVQRLHSESLRSTAAPTSVVGANDRHKRLFNWYADAWRELQSERDWRWMRGTTDVALTVGQQTYTGAGLGIANFGRWRQDDSTYSPVIYMPASINSLWHLEFMDLDVFRHEFVYRTWGDTTPIAWSYDEDDQMLVGPAPAEAYMLRIEYWKEPTELTVDTDTPGLPDRFALLPMWRALQEVAKADAAPEVLARAEKNYEVMHNDMMRDQARRPHL